MVGAGVGGRLRAVDHDGNDQLIEFFVVSFDQDDCLVSAWRDGSDRDVESTNDSFFTFLAGQFRRGQHLDIQ